jgi:hypothetical protein
MKCKNTTKIHFEIIKTKEVFFRLKMLQLLSRTKLKIQNTIRYFLQEHINSVTPFGKRTNSQKARLKQKNLTPSKILVQVTK